jgi:hypothetical protein
MNKLLIAGLVALEVGAAMTISSKGRDLTALTRKLRPKRALGLWKADFQSVSTAEIARRRATMIDSSPLAARIAATC